MRAREARRVEARCIPSAILKEENGHISKEMWTAVQKSNFASFTSPKPHASHHYAVFTRPKDVSLRKNIFRTLVLGIETDRLCSYEGYARHPTAQNPELVGVGE